MASSNRTRGASARSGNNTARRKAPAAKTQSQKPRIIEGVIKDLFSKAKGDMDYTMLTIIIAVVAAGLVMLLSASAPRANSSSGDSYYFFKRQLFFAVVGMIGMLVLSKVSYKRYIDMTPYLAAGSVLLLILVLIPGIGVKINGARRWLFGVIQPSELVKPVVGIVFARAIAVRNLDLSRLRSYRGLIPAGIFLALVAGLMVLEPHVSGTIIIVGIAAVIMIAAGLPIVPVLIFGSIALVAVVGGSYLLSPTRWARITSFIDPFSDTQGNSYQIVQSIYAIGSGGITGLGLGQSVQKFMYLPEPYNDFIFAIVCEELGLVGAIGVMGLFAVLIWRGVRIAMNAPDKYSMLLATGIVAQIGIQATMNMGVATGTIPNTGAALPFFSYGGTSMLTLLCEMGILLNISRASKSNYKVL